MNEKSGVASRDSWIVWLAGCGSIISVYLVDSFVTCSC
jgi:hypothetical protein